MGQTLKEQNRSNVWLDHNIIASWRNTRYAQGFLNGRVLKEVLQIWCCCHCYYFAKQILLCRVYAVYNLSSNRHLFVFLKIRGDQDELQRPEHNILCFHGDDLDEAYDKINSNPFENRAPILYLGFPCTKDRIWKKRFPNVSNCTLISDGLYDWFERWVQKPVHERGRSRLPWKNPSLQRFLEILCEFVRQVKGKVEFIHMATPLTEESGGQEHTKAIHTTLCTPDKFSETNLKWTNQKTETSNLYVALHRHSFQVWPVPCMLVVLPLATFSGMSKQLG